MDYIIFRQSRSGKERVDVEDHEEEYNNLISAAEENNTTEAERLLQDKDCQVNQTDWSDFTALHVASYHGNTEIVERILAHEKCNGNAAMKDFGWTALHLAAQKGYTDIIKLLLRHQVCIDAAVNDGRTALHISAQQGHIEAVVFLIEKKADINATTNDKRTPLHIACQRQRARVVTALIQHKCLVNFPEEEGLTALHFAAQQGYKEIVDVLLHCSECDAGAVDDFGWKASHLAAQNGHDDIFKLLLQHESDVDVAVKDGRTALHIAANNGHMDIVSHLLKLRSNVNAVMNDGRTPLQLAAQKGHSEITELLIKHKSRVDATEEDDWTALHLTAHNGHADTVAVLIQNKECSVNATVKKSGETALHLAAARSHTRIVSLLLSHPKVDAGIKNSENETALCSALQGASDPAFTCSKSTYDMIKALALAQGVDVNAPRSNLALAVEHASLEVVELLLCNGADADSINNDLPALHRAIRMNSPDRCRLLLEHGADINAKFNDMTPLQHAVIHLASPQIIQILLNYIPESIDVSALLQCCVVPGRNEPIICHAVNLGVKSFVEALACSSSLEELDFTGVNACQLSYKYPEIKAWLQKKYPDIMKKYEDPELEELYGKRKSTQPCIQPEQQLDAMPITCSELYSASVSFKQHHGEINEINELALGMLKLASQHFEDIFLRFEPQIRGSVGEGTKVALPDELDVVCFLTELKEMQIENCPLSNTHRRIKAGKLFPLTHVCDKDGYIITAELASAFYAHLIKSLTRLSVQYYKGKHGYLFLPRMFFDKHEKISCIRVMWRGNIFKNLVLKIDVVPALTYPEYKLETPVPLNESTHFYFITKWTGFIGFEIDVPISYSDCERDMIIRLPTNIKEGYILAKACRDARACGSNVTSHINEPIQIDDYLTSYRLKTCLMFILKAMIDSGDTILTDSDSKEEWAKRIYSYLIRILENGKIASYYEPDNQNCYIFSCYHDINTPVGDRGGCCQKRHIMLEFCRNIIAFIDGK